MPPYYPVFLDLRGRRVVVIGGGPTGEEKVERLVDFGADVVVFSPKVTRAVRLMAEEGRLSLHRRRYRSGDLEGAFIAIVADNRDADLNEEVSREAAERNVPLNVNDVTHLCTWIAPSMVRNGDVIIAASTGGSSPALARKLREELAGTSRTGSRFRPIEYGDLAPLLSEVRTELLEQDIRPKPDHWQASITEDLMDMVRSGETERARETLLSNLMIGADCDCPGRTCQMWEDLAARRSCEATGPIPIEDHYRPGSPRQIEAARLREKGMSFSEIGKRMGITRQRALQLAQKGRRFLNTGRNPDGRGGGEST